MYCINTEEKETSGNFCKWTLYFRSFDSFDHFHSGYNTFFSRKTKIEWIQWITSNPERWVKQLIHIVSSTSVFLKITCTFKPTGAAPSSAHYIKYDERWLCLKKKHKKRAGPVNERVYAKNEPFREISTREPRNKSHFLTWRMTILWSRHFEERNTAPSGKRAGPRDFHCAKKTTKNFLFQICLPKFISVRLCRADISAFVQAPPWCLQATNKKKKKKRGALPQSSSWQGMYGSWSAVSLS